MYIMYMYITCTYYMYIYMYKLHVHYVHVYNKLHVQVICATGEQYHTNINIRLLSNGVVCAQIGGGARLHLRDHVL